MALDLNIPLDERDEEAFPDLNQPVGEQEEERLAGEEEVHLGGVIQRTANHVLPFHLNLHASDQQEDMHSAMVFEHN
uniref:BEACH domain-containing protein n=1 Tax=Oryza punctata TaxID=4537 RepID=A0A0E0KE90_ORYPU